MGKVFGADTAHSAKAHSVRQRRVESGDGAYVRPSASVERPCADARLRGERTLSSRSPSLALYPSTVHSNVSSIRTHLLKTVTTTLENCTCAVPHVIRTRVRSVSGNVAMLLYSPKDAVSLPGSMTDSSNGIATLL